MIYKSTITIEHKDRQNCFYGKHHHRTLISNEFHVEQWNADDFPNMSLTLTFNYKDKHISICGDTREINTRGDVEDGIAVLFNDEDGNLYETSIPLEHSSGEVYECNNTDADAPDCQVVGEYSLSM